VAISFIGAIKFKIVFIIPRDDKGA
jgi:hypothetical protein